MKKLYFITIFIIIDLLLSQLFLLRILENDILNAHTESFENRIFNKDYKYTFKKLGNGLGMMGLRFHSIYSDLLELFLKENTKLNLHLLYGDFEGFSKLNCERLKETEASFLKKIRGITWNI